MSLQHLQTLAIKTLSVSHTTKTISLQVLTKSYLELKITEWTVPASLDSILETYSDYNPKFLKFLKLAENPKIWQMRSLGPISTWINGRTCLAGDAAHSMMPSKIQIYFKMIRVTYAEVFLALGQGAAQAVEDAITLSVFLPKGTKREEVPKRLQMYEETRKERAEFVQKYSYDQLFSHETRFNTGKVLFKPQSYPLKRKHSGFYR